MDEREDIERRLRNLEEIFGFLLLGQYESPPGNVAPATRSVAEQLRLASARNDLNSMLQWLRDKLPYFERQRILGQNVAETRIRIAELEELLAKRASLDLGIDSRTVPLQRFVPVRLWLDTDDDDLAYRIQRDVERLTQTMGLESAYGFASEHGSLFYRWWGKTKDALTSDEMLERLQKAERAVELATLGRAQAEMDQKQAAAAAQLIDSLKSIPNAVCAVGSVVVVKITDDKGPRVVVQTLTQTQMIAVERDDRLVRNPHRMLKFLHEMEDASAGRASLSEGEPTTRTADVSHPDRGA